MSITRKRKSPRTRAAKLLRDARDQLGLTVKELAKRGYLDPQRLYEYEIGSRQISTVQSIAYYAILYELDPVELFKTILEDLDDGGKAHEHGE